MHGNHSVRVKGRKRLLSIDESTTEQPISSFNTSSSASQEPPKNPPTVASLKLPVLGKKVTVEKAAVAVTAAKKEETLDDTTSLISRFPQLTLAVPAGDFMSASEAWGNCTVATGRLFDPSKSKIKEPSAPRPSRAFSPEDLSVVDLDDDVCTTIKPSFGSRDDS
jgi:hypothetical protein